MRLVQDRHSGAAGAVVQRQADLGKGGVWTPVDHTLDLGSTPMVDRLKGRIAGWPVEVTGASLNLKGSLEQGTSGDATARAVIGSPSKSGVRVDYSVLSARALDASPLRTSIEPSLSVKGRWELTAGKTELSADVVGTMLAMSVNGKLKVVELKWDDKTLAANNGRPTGAVFAGSVSGGFPALAFTYQDSGGVSHSFNGAARITVDFAANWSAIGRYLLRSVAGLGPSLIPLATAAGLAGLVWSGYVNARHERQVAAQARAVARGLIRASDIYAGRMLDQEAGGGDGAAGALAATRAGIDLSGVLSRFRLTQGQYLGALDLAERRDAMFIYLSRDYTRAALRTFEGQMRDRVTAWHREHWLVTFLSGRYSSDTMALVYRVIDTEVTSHGRPVLR